MNVVILYMGMMDEMIYFSYVSSYMWKAKTNGNTDGCNNITVMNISINKYHTNVLLYHIIITIHKYTIIITDTMLTINRRIIFKNVGFSQNYLCYRGNELFNDRCYRFVFLEMNYFVFLVDWYFWKWIILYDYGVDLLQLWKLMSEIVMKNYQSHICLLYICDEDICSCDVWKLIISWIVCRNDEWYDWKRRIIFKKCWFLLNCWTMIFVLLLQVWYLGIFHCYYCDCCCGVCEKQK